MLKQTIKPGEDAVIICKCSIHANGGPSGRWQMTASQIGHSAERQLSDGGLIGAIRSYVPCRSWISQIRGNQIAKDIPIVFTKPLWLKNIEKKCSQHYFYLPTSYFYMDFSSSFDNKFTFDLWVLIRCLRWYDGVINEIMAQVWETGQTIIITLTPEMRKNPYLVSIICE